MVIQSLFVSGILVNIYLVGVLRVSIYVLGALKDLIYAFHKLYIEFGKLPKWSITYTPMSSATSLIMRLYNPSL